MITTIILALLGVVTGATIFWAGVNTGDKRHCLHLKRIERGELGRFRDL